MQFNVTVKVRQVGIGKEKLDQYVFYPKDFVVTSQTQDYRSVFNAWQSQYGKDWEYGGGFVFCKA